MDPVQKFLGRNLFLSYIMALFKGINDNAGARAMVQR